MIVTRVLGCGGGGGRWLSPKVCAALCASHRAQSSVLFHWHNNETLMRADPDIANTVRNVMYPDGSAPNADDVGGWYSATEAKAVQLRMVVDDDRVDVLTNDEFTQWEAALVAEVQSWTFPAFKVGSCCGRVCVCLCLHHTEHVAHVTCPFRFAVNVRVSCFVSHRPLF